MPRHTMASPDLMEKSPFIADERETRNRGKQSQTRLFQRNQYTAAHGVLYLIQLLLLAVNVSFFISNAACLRGSGYEHSDDHRLERTFSPAEVALKYVAVEELTNEQSSSPYTGEPRAELDQAWSKLLRSTLLRMTNEEMIRMNKTSLALLDGGGYVGYLEVFHMLHCLKRIYQSHHPEHYPEQQRDGAFTAPHLYHCLDVLREGVMCNADVTVNTLVWENSQKVRGARPGPRKCIDWNQLEAWAADRILIASDRDTFLETLVVPFDDAGSMGPVELLR
ncbi:hypothetical protein F4777DRAFT_130811 [Nemania sp. FL0916]|nr:hypothetical protein F4777DRAFT_130811 [Nemania sp. FL0916]